MNPSIQVFFWWLLFAGTHLGFSSKPVRENAIAHTGERTFLGLYTLVSFATFIPLAWTYAHHRHAGPLLWRIVAVPGASGIGLLLSALGWVLVVLAMVQPSATGMVPGAAVQARGIIRITRHPLFVGLGLWDLGHALSNGFLSDVIFFGGFALFGLVGGVHQDARKRATAGEQLAPFFAETSLLPFAAILGGRTRFVPGEIPPLGLAVGVLVATGLYLAHGWMFG